MRRSTAAVCGLSRILFSTGAFFWFFYFLVVITEPGEAGLSVPVPLAGFAVTYCAGRCLSYRGVKLLNYILIQIVICAAGIAVMQYMLTAGPDTFNFRLMTSIAYASCAAVLANASASDIRAAELSRRFDAGLLLIVLLILSDHYLRGGHLRPALYLLGAALLMILLALTMIRTERNAAVGSSAGRFLPAVLLAIMALIAAAAAVFGSGGAGSAAGAVITVIRGFFRAIAAAASFLWSKWSAFCGWLATLISSEESVPVNIDVPDQQELPPEMTEPSRTSIILLYVLTALLVVAVITAFVLMIRRIRLKRSRSVRLNNRQVIRSGGISSGLKDALSALALRIRYRISCIRCRNTPAGLLDWCERHAPRSAGKKPSETGPQFVSRLAEGQEGPQSEALLTLAELLEKAFYSPETADADPSLCAAVRSCRF